MLSSLSEHFGFNLNLDTGKQVYRTLANSEDQDEMPHSAAFHQGLHCLLKIKTIFRGRNIS